MRSSKMTHLQDIGKRSGNRVGTGQLFLRKNAAPAKQRDRTNSKKENQSRPFWNGANAAGFHCYSLHKHAGILESMKPLLFE